VQKLLVQKLLVNADKIDYYTLTNIHTYTFTFTYVRAYLHTRAHTYSHLHPNSNTDTERLTDLGKLNFLIVVQFWLELIYTNASAASKNTARLKSGQN